MPTKSWGAGKRTCLHLPKPGARVQAVCWLRRRGHRGLGRGRWTQEAQAEGHTLHLPSPPLPHQGMQASGSPGEGPGRKLSKTTAPGGQMVSKTFLLNSAVKQKQYSCPLELGGGSDAADEVLCVQQLNTHTHIPTPVDCVSHKSRNAEECQKLPRKLEKARHGFSPEEIQFQ